MPPSPPNDVDKIGYWGPPTSTLDWCEYNYEISFYIAEFWNTVSNLVMIIPPMWGIWLGMKNQIGTRLILCYLSLFVVGIGSWLFHMTLLYEMQLMDELPMVWGTLASAYTLFDINAPRSQVNWWLALLLVAYGTVITVVYITINIPIFHQIAYGILVTTCFLYSYILSRRKYFPLRWFILSLGMYLMGFCVWNIDNVFCQQLRDTRQHLGGLLSPITQLHAWWHFFAGYASYLSILYLQQARLTVLEQPGSIELGVLGLHFKMDDKRDRSE